MPQPQHLNRLTRRSFLQGAGALGGSALLLKTLDTNRSASAAEQALPKRTLGRTGVEVGTLALGTWPSGKCDTIDDQGVERLVNEALDLGVNLIDTARAYDNAESGIGRVLRRRRDEVFLTTKVWADTASDAQKSFEASLRAMGTDHVDLLYIHSIGDRDVDKVMGSGGALEYLLKQQEAGKTRFLGISGHCRPKAFVRLIETGKIDVLMCAMNFVDRHTYNFEENVLPAARRQNMGIACMKVFGGMKGGFGTADGPNPGPQMDERHLQAAINYSLALPGVATLVIGVHTVEQLRQNAAMVQGHAPLSPQDQARLAELGQRLAKQWGPHLGPVA